MYLKVHFLKSSRLHPKSTLWHFRVCWGSTNPQSKPNKYVPCQIKTKTTGRIGSVSRPCRPNLIGFIWGSSMYRASGVGIGGCPCDQDCMPQYVIFFLWIHFIIWVSLVFIKSWGIFIGCVTKMSPVTLFPFSLYLFRYWADFAILTPCALYLKKKKCEVPNFFPRIRTWQYQMTFYRKFLGGPLGMGKNISQPAQHCAIFFSTPTLGEHNLHNSIENNLHITSMLVSR